MDNPHAPVQGATEPDEHTPGEVARSQRQQRVTQWSVPVLTGLLVLMSSWMGEQQRPGEVASGIFGRLRPGK